MSVLRLAFVTTEDSSSLKSWSGIPFHMARALVQQGVTLERVGPLRTAIVPRALARGRQLLHRTLVSRGVPLTAQVDNVDKDTDGARVASCGPQRSCRVASSSH